MFDEKWIKEELININRNQLHDVEILNEKIDIQAKRIDILNEKLICLENKKYKSKMMEAMDKSKMMEAMDFEFGVR